MKTEFSLQQKNTNVRRNNNYQALRFFLQNLQKVSPNLAAQTAEKLFCTPRRTRRPSKEEEAMLFATPLPVVIGGKQLAAWQWGEGPTILLIHGWSGRASQLGAFVDPLVYAGFRVVAVDVAGHGSSPGSSATLVDFADAIYATAAAAGGVEGIICHSFGAAGTWLALSRGLSAQRVVMLSPVGSLQKAVAQFSKVLGLSPDTKELFYERMARRTGISVYAADRETIAPQMRTPLLIVHDTTDKEVPIQNSRELNQLWPLSQLIETQNLGHNRILWDQDVVMKAASFVARVDLQQRPYILNEAVDALYLQ